jgi:hypothetical protein
VATDGPDDNAYPGDKSSMGTLFYRFTFSGS